MTVIYYLICLKCKKRNVYKTVKRGYEGGKVRSNSDEDKAIAENAPYLL